MCVGRYAEKTQWSEAKWNLFEPLARSNLFGQMPAIDMLVLCIPAECDNIKLPSECEIASRWDAYLLCDICRHFASVMLHFASLISHILRCILAYTHQIPNGISLHLFRDNLYIIPNAKALFFSILRQKYAPFAAISITISVRYNPTDRKNRPFGLRTVPLVCFGL